MPRAPLPASAALAALALGLASCATSGAVGTAVTAAQVGGALYCLSITEEARAAVREAVTGGVKVIPCRAAPAEASPP